MECWVQLNFIEQLYQSLAGEQLIHKYETIETIVTKKLSHSKHTIILRATEQLNR